MQTPRRRILVDRRFQLQYAMIWLWVAIMVLTALGVFYFVLHNSLNSPGMEPLILRLVGGISFFVVCFCSLMGVLTTTLTHRVAGAAFSLQRNLDHLRSNDFDAPVRLRPADYLQTLAGELDDLRLGLAAQRDATLAVASALAAVEGLTDAQRATVDKAASDLRGLVAVKPPPVPPPV